MGFGRAAGEHLARDVGSAEARAEDRAAGEGLARRRARPHNIAEAQAELGLGLGATAAEVPQAGSTTCGTKSRRFRYLFPIPRLPKPPAAISRCTRALARARRRVRVQELANAAIDALNKLFAPSDSEMSRAARDAGASPAAGSRIHEAQKYIISCIIPFVDLPASGVSPNYSTENDPNDNVGYGAVGR